MNLEKKMGGKNGFNFRLRYFLIIIDVKELCYCFV